MLRHAHGFMLLESFDGVAVRTERLILAGLILQYPIIVGHATTATASKFFAAATLNMVNMQSAEIRKVAMSTSISVFLIDSTTKLPLS